jgi:hypothetical protein
MYERSSMERSPGCETMPLEVQIASPVGRWRLQSASPPSAAIGDEDTLQPTTQPASQMLSRMCQTAS